MKLAENCKSSVISDDKHDYEIKVRFQTEFQIVTRRDAGIQKLEANFLAVV